MRKASHISDDLLRLMLTNPYCERIGGDHPVTALARELLACRDALRSTLPSRYPDPGENFCGDMEVGQHFDGGSMSASKDWLRYKSYPRKVWKAARDLIK